MNIDDINEGHYAQHKSSVTNSIQRVIEDDPDIYIDEFKAFNYLVCDLCSEAPPETFVLTDGAYDQGIDFYTIYERSYEIFQCKFASLEDILKSNKPLSFNKDGVTELENAFKYLTGEKVPDTAKSEVKKLRGQVVTEGYDHISFNLCVFGYLTEDAEQKFDELKRKYGGDSEKFSFRLFTWRDIISYIVGKTFQLRRIVINSKYMIGRFYRLMIIVIL